MKILCACGIQGFRFRALIGSRIYGLRGKGREERKDGSEDNKFKNA